MHLSLSGRKAIGIRAKTHKSSGSNIPEMGQLLDGFATVVFEVE
jgi:hypothetical protein